MTILTILILNIFLPTLDMGTDINLVVKLYVGANDTDTGSDSYGQHFSHPVMATAMLLFFLLNYFVCLYTSFRLARSKKYTKYTFIFALINLFPQFGKTNTTKFFL